MVDKAPGRKSRGSDSGRPIMVLLDVLGQRWTLRILWELRERRLNFRDLRSHCDQLSPTLLNRRLRTLRELQLIDHRDGEGYGHTALGAELSRQLLGLQTWAEHWAEQIP